MKRRIHGNPKSYLTPDTGLRTEINQRAQAGINHCWTCGSCDFECPVNAATGRLRPQKLVRMANFGLIDELIQEPSIWYCQSCRRCQQICPNTVKPSELISHIRSMVLERKLISTERFRSYRNLFEHFQRVRKHVTALSFHKELHSISDRQWCDWLLSPVVKSRGGIHIKSMRRNLLSHPCENNPSSTMACFTCGECSSACPISCEQSVFDPRSLFRMFNLGLVDELLKDPAIWLCLECGRCTDACSQNVDGCEIIRRRRLFAVQHGHVTPNFFMRLEKANQLVYARWLDEVDALLGLNNKPVVGEIYGFDDFSACCCNYALTELA